MGPETMILGFRGRAFYLRPGTTTSNQGMSMGSAMGMCMGISRATVTVTVTATAMVIPLVLGFPS